MEKDGKCHVHVIHHIRIGCFVVFYPFPNPGGDAHPIPSPWFPRSKAPTSTLPASEPVPSPRVDGSPHSSRRPDRSRLGGASANPRAPRGPAKDFMEGTVVWWDSKSAKFTGLAGAKRREWMGMEEWDDY